MASVFVNLLSKEYLDSKNIQFANAFALLGLLLTLVILGVGTWQYVLVYRITKEQQIAQAELNRWNPELAQWQRVQDLDNKIKLTASKVKRIKSKARNCSYLLTVVHSKIPADVVLVQQTIKQDGISLQIEAQSLESIGEFSDSLGGESTFTNVDLRTITGDGKSLKATIQINFARAGQKK